MSLAVALVAVAALFPAALRWLRVAQREHYLAGSVSRFAARWWLYAGIVNTVCLAAAAGAAIAAWWLPAVGLLTAVVAASGPIGLGVRGRTSKLVWTRRLKTTALVLAGMDALVAVAGALTGRIAAGLVALTLLEPVVLDVALAITRPFERRAMAQYVRSASDRLAGVAPLVIAVTGSFGKTTTKLYTRHLISGSRSVLASPASFNNTGGLSRTLNEHLSPGTEIFIAEMGAYRRGEIAALCSWVRPTVSAIVNIGPVHLERMGSLDNIVAAKSEIVETADTVVLNVDAYGLTALAERAEAAGKTVIRCSSERVEAVDVAVIDGRAFLRGADLGAVDLSAEPANVAVAIGMAIAVGVEPARLAERAVCLPAVDHRHQVHLAPSGVTVIDNTFSSNPSSTRSSLRLLASRATPGRRAVVVTPGMVELGHQQHSANRAFGQEAAQLATDVLVVGRTNSGALDEGARIGPATVHHVASRDEAVAWVRATLGPGDVVLYENDLPDHYP